MKKRYEPPFVELVEFNAADLLALSILGNPKDEGSGNDWADSYDASQNRSDWDNIWANME